jgi:hypothetical protein
MIGGRGWIVIALSMTFSVLFAAFLISLHSTHRTCDHLALHRSLPKSYVCEPDPHLGGSV